MLLFGFAAQYTGSGADPTNTSGTLFEGIARWHDVKKTQTLENARERALKGIQEVVALALQAEGCIPHLLNWNNRPNCLV